MSSAFISMAQPCDCADASSSSDSSVSPQLSPRKKGRLERDASSTTSIAQSFKLHELLCNLCDSDGTHYPDFIVSEITAAFEHDISHDSLAPLRGAAFQTKRCDEACNWRLCFGAIPSKCRDGYAVLCRSAAGVVQSEYVQILRYANENCFRHPHDWQSNIDENRRRLIRAEMLYIAAVANSKGLSHDQHHSRRSTDIVAEVCFRASFEELLVLKGANDADTTACLHALANSLANQNKFGEARQCYVKCIAATEAACGKSESSFQLQLELANMLFKQGGLEEAAVICVHVLTESDRNSNSALLAAAHISRLAEQAAKSKSAFHCVEMDSACKVSRFLTKVFEHALSLDVGAESSFFRPFISLLKNKRKTDATSSLSNVPVLQFLLIFFEFAQVLLNAKTYNSLMVRFERMGLQNCFYYLSCGDWQRAGLIVPPWNPLDFWNDTVKYSREVSTPFALPANVDSLPLQIRMHSILYSSSLPPNINLSLPKKTKERFLWGEKKQAMCEPELMQLVAKLRKHPEHITQLNLSQQLSRFEISSTATLELTECLAALTDLQQLDLSSYASQSLNEIDASLARSLMVLTGLKTLNLSGTVRTHFFQNCVVSIAQLTALEHLDLSSARNDYVCLSPDIEANFGRSLMLLTGLKTLNVSGLCFISSKVETFDFCHSILSSMVQLRKLQSLFVDVPILELVKHGCWLQSGFVVPPFDILFSDSSNDSSLIRAQTWANALRYAREVSTPFALPANVDSLPLQERKHAILYSSSLPPNIDTTNFKLCEAELMQLLQKLHQHSRFVTCLNMEEFYFSSANLTSMIQEAWKSIADSACLQQYTHLKYGFRNVFSTALPFLTRLHTLVLECDDASIYQSLPALVELRRLDIGHRFDFVGYFKDNNPTGSRTLKVTDALGRGQTALTLNLYSYHQVPPSLFPSLKSLNRINCRNCGEMLSCLVGLQTLRIIRNGADSEVPFFPPIDVAFCQSLAALTGLQSLDMYATFNAESATAFLHSCASMTGLKSLSFSILYFEDQAVFVEFCQSLALLKMLQILDIKIPRDYKSGISISDLGDFYEVLKSMHNLDTLIIGRYNWGFYQAIKDIETLNQSLILLTGLTTLKLPRVEVGDSITSLLTALTELQTLDLQWTAISGQAFPDMCRSLLFLTKLQYLNLSHNFRSIDSTTASEQFAAFFRALESMTTLRILDLSRCFDSMDLSCYGDIFASSLFQLTSLESALLGQPVHQSVYRGTWQRSGLFVPPWDILHVKDGAPSFQSEWIKVLQHCRQFSYPFPFPLDFKALSKEQQRHAILYSNSIPAHINLKELRDPELLQLAQQFRSHPEHVTHLSLEGKFDQMDLILHLAAVITNLTALQTLSLDRTIYGHNSDNDCDFLPQALSLTAMTSLLELDLTGFNLQAERGFDIGRALTGMSGLRTLKIANCHFCDICEEKLCDEKLCTLSASLLNLTLLEQLDVSGFNLRTEGGFDIGRALAGMSGLRTLKIAQSCLCETSFTTFCASLLNLTKLEQFEVAYLRNFNMHALVTALMAPALNKLTSLKMLNLAGISLDKHSCCRIARYFMRLPQLQNLLLCHKFMDCNHEWNLIVPDMPRKQTHYFDFSKHQDDWIYALRHQVCCQFANRSCHHLTQTLSICLPASFSCMLGDSVTPDFARSAEIYHTLTQSQLFLLSCLGGHSGHFFRVIMPRDTRWHKDPRSVVIEHLFSKRMKQKLFQLRESTNRHRFNYFLGSDDSGHGDGD